MTHRNMKHKAADEVADSMPSVFDGLSTPTEGKVLPLLRPIHRFLYPRVTDSRFCAYVMRWQRLCGIHSNGNITNPVLHAYFCLASMLGDEIFYLFPLLVWLAFPLALSVTINMGILLPLGQLFKDLLHLPRPPRTFSYAGKQEIIVKLENAYGTEYGMPSTHAMSGSLIFCVMHAIYRMQGCILEKETPAFLMLGVPAHWAALGAFVTLSVCASRLYMGVHSVADLFVGLCLSGFVQWLMLGCGLEQRLSSLLYNSTYGPLFPLLAILLFVKFYPATTPWSKSYATASELFGLSTALSVSYWVALRRLPQIGVFLVQTSIVTDYCSPTALQAGNPKNFIEWRSLGARLALGGALTAATRLVAKHFFTVVLVRLVRLGWTVVPSAQEIDTEGKLVPLEKSYVVEPPRRILGLLCTVSMCVLGVPMLWAKLGMVPSSV